MILESFIGYKVLQAVVASQRPVILVLMGVACPAFIVIGVWSIVKFGYPMLNGDFGLKDDPNLVLLYGFVSLVCIPPFLLSWVCARYTKKAWAEIKESGAIYKD